MKRWRWVPRSFMRTKEWKKIRGMATLREKKEGKRYWLYGCVLSIAVLPALASEEQFRSIKAVLSLGRILKEIAHEQDERKESISMEERVASILASMAHEQTFRQTLVAHGGLDLLLKTLPNATDYLLQNRILEAIASVASTNGAQVAFLDLDATSHLLFHLPDAHLPLFDRLKIDVALKRLLNEPHPFSIPTDLNGTCERLIKTMEMMNATLDERQFILIAFDALFQSLEAQNHNSLDTALSIVLANDSFLERLRQLTQKHSPLQTFAANLLVTLYRLAGLRSIALNDISSWHQHFCQWAYMENVPTLQLASAQAFHVIAKQMPNIIVHSKSAQDALLQLARSTFKPTSSTLDIQMHVCSIVSTLGESLSNGLNTTLSTPMSSVFEYLDLPFADAEELDATPLYGWVDVLTQWTFHGTSAVRRNAIDSLTRLALQKDSAASQKVLQSWMLSLLREMFSSRKTNAEELRAVREVETLAQMSYDTAPGYVKVSYNPSVMEAGMAAMAILAEKHAPDFIWKGGVDLLSLVAITSSSHIKSQCARVLANIAAYPYSSTELDRNVQDILIYETEGGPLFFDEITHWSDEPNASIRSNYFRAATNLSTAHFNQGPIYREGIHPIAPKTINSDSNKPTVDVVFVHGLRGHPFGTWRSDMTLKDMENSPIWPEALLAPDLSNESRLVTLGYEAGMVTWSSPWPSLTLPERAKMMLASLEAAQIGRKDGPPVIFITHSMGGLLVKELLVLAKGSSLVERTAGVVFMAVPHFGANLSSKVNAQAIRTLIQAHPATKDLSANAPHLLALHKAYQALDIPSLSFGEGKAAPLALGVKAMVVLPESANPGGPHNQFHLLSDTDHMDICKPKTRRDPRYALLHEFLIECLHNKPK
ncbi:hypothetical protein THRCLA_02590 [Thraustotheca clavata]|uniref:Protein SERAC1 n=1 Tax=Thraustotheca clavata TaxID=74557 RepID=A0A1W0A4V2_9STRA|nr:hypothetical protein THRCLA_02590 [Thraustotheca clavata]